MFERPFFRAFNIANSKRIPFDAPRSWSSHSFLLRIVDAILVLLLVVFPFVMGGREAWGHRILISLAAALGFVWCVHRACTGGRLVSLVDGREYPVPAKGVMFGRDASCDIVIPSNDVSRNHAEIQAGPDGYYVIDLSSNGVFVNGARVEGTQTLFQGNLSRGTTWLR